MTREEAIKGLKSLVEVRRKYGDMQTMKDEIECLDMAIKALDQEPKTDTWSIKDVADTLAKHGLIAEQEPCEDCCNGNQEEKAKLCQKSYLAGMKHGQEPCGKDINVSTTDAISRQAVLNILDDMVKDYINENDFDKAGGIAWVKVQKLTSVSSSENPNKWIPLIKRPMTDEERECYRVRSDIKEGMIFDCPLPEGGQDVLVYHSGYVSVDTFYTYDGWCDFGSACIDDVQAWMPLPEPYKESPTGAESENKE